jgi:pimeloyl-ACP methyl ester carboxylesterase
MPFANNRGVRIHYETVGHGRPLILHHGTFGSGPDWIDRGYVERLKSDCQLILVDARGHGLSDKPHDPAAYDLSLRASDVVTIMDDLNLPRADYYGYSMGGWIAFGLAQYAPERFSSFIIGAAHPYPESMKPYRELMPQSIEAFTAMMDARVGKLQTPAMRERMLKNDLDALRALTQDRVSIADVLPSMRMPCLLYVGDLDPRLAPMQDCAKALSNATMFTLPGYDHITANWEVDTIVPHVKTFLAKVARQETQTAAE